MTTFTEKEQKALVAIFKDNGSGAKTADEMKSDNMSWFNVQTIMDAGFSREAASGLMSSLEEKGATQNYEPGHEAGWVLTDKGIDWAFEAVQKQLSK